jgi:ATP-dependent DNA ligase
MLARPGDLPLRGCAYEVKWDGFRALVSTEDGFDVRSRRGWAMAELVPGLAGLPSGLVLDGELVAFGDDGRPSFPVLSARVLHGKKTIAGRTGVTVGKSSWRARVVAPSRSSQGSGERRPAPL